MSHRIAAVVVFALLIFSFALAPACRREPGIDMRWGTHREHMGASADEVVEATREAITAMNLQLIEERTRGGETRFETRNAFDTHVRITVEPAGEASTRVGVRADRDAEGLRLEVFNQIRSRLPGAAPRQ
ncbi:MAG: DUF3568 family protein [Phycisphaeraceae bacterium]